MITRYVKDSVNEVGEGRGREGRCSRYHIEFDKEDRRKGRSKNGQKIVKKWSRVTKKRKG